MEIQFQHANPYSGRESVVLRIDGLLSGQTVCVLVDAGQNVDVTDLLNEDENEYLAAICLTHAHLDHYQSLGDNLVHGAPVYATTDTATMLEDVFAAGEDHYELSNTNRVLEQLEPIVDWTQIVPGLRVHPVPAGHTPGAAGFLFEITDGDESRTILVTGDFTDRRAAGYPGFDSELPVDVDILVLTAATNDQFDSTLTDAVATICERVWAGSTVLTTVSGLTGLQVAYLLGHLAEQWDERLPITLAGHVAKLYDRLKYTIPNVESIPEFTDPAAILAPDAVTIAGPEVPVDGSAERLFESVSEDPGATLVQLINGGSSPVTNSACTIHQFSLSNHPTPQMVDDVVEALTPVHVIITHQKGAAANQYKDKYASFVWATDDTDCYTLLDESGWTPPPWVTESTTRRVHSETNRRGRLLGDALDGDVPLPTATRLDDVSLDAEGLNLEALRDRLSVDRTEQTLAESSGVPHGTDGCLESVGSAKLDGVSGASTTADETSDSDIDTALEKITSRLDQIETAVTERGVDARVVDAGNGTILLRLVDPPDQLEHGQQLRVILSEMD
ncbi:putative exonuclease of the beta-lactamase fold involved in RNA processing [Haloferax elongans ATCC BAA-1513]|uniref:Putative exonuclease of the beta-lactamase fold involved in RNA processing n=1 Tax=Haloferax elongans ATCC BAA-1513 TaxID=1230453 RepID=M0HV29_HALEO|nr:MBL fold metallo-hydrolase [Haloferax elongans]ELZ88470.1 putative exonuclease of the beta-lactamase fold involved in RNA processing [Haloferax elongans ATCC BAA-1513]